MENTLALTKDLLAGLVSFPTLSGESNLEMIAYIQQFLEEYGIECSLTYDESGARANLYAVIGPEIEGGIMFNGHSDVVPTFGQQWTNDPFELTEQAGKLYGRGAVDMKGFIACMLAIVPELKQQSLQRPVQLSVCFDEEIGGYGASILAQDLASRQVKPALAVVGEPTAMRLVTGHKGGYELRTEIFGFEVHASDPSKGVNAIEFATKYINKILEYSDKQREIEVPDSQFAPPFTTVNVGQIGGGVARNITAGYCSFDWEIRPIPGTDGMAIIEEILAFAREELLPQMKSVSSSADIRTTIIADVPALKFDERSDAMELVRAITGANTSENVSFATDAGYFQRVGIPTVVYGPGSIEQAHKPDEFIETSELQRCLEFMRSVARYQAM
ncbi:acetylornithine deacetylase [Rhodobacteraceae bacterium RKSG542]|uniref:acetylornithine deacetylase n=1 Tax=Pseudovibrio flavus TaxID=2529854 RepID=UPI0012BC9E18|nr:acetylornithine deacetylase [Pseudovibrio flavus]MTI17496.1 acetylornithine deacetylase [Pseudovibrio flavus]